MTTGILSEEEIEEEIAREDKEAANEMKSYRLSSEEIGVWERFAVAFATGTDTSYLQTLSGYEVGRCKRIARYADQMLIEWRKRNGTSGNPYRD